MPIRAGIYGATGYTGLELIRLLNEHTEVEIAFATPESSAGSSLRLSWPTAPETPPTAAPARIGTSAVPPDATIDWP